MADSGFDYKVSYLCMYIENDMAVFQIDVRYFA